MSQFTCPSVDSTDIVFVDDEAAQEFDCSICLEKFKHPVVIGCPDHLFCGGCIVQLVGREGNIFRCPTCRHQCHSSQIQSNGFVKRRMLSLTVKCVNHQITEQRQKLLQQIHHNQLRNRRRNRNNNNSQNHRRNHNRQQSPSPSRSRSRSRERENNENQEEKQENVEICNWSGPWHGLEAHINQCVLHTLQCKYCKRFLLRRDSQNHAQICPLQPVDCNLCHKTIPRCRLAHHLENTCGEIAIHCIHCNQQILRKQKRAHVIRTCPETQIRCNYAKYGCNATFKRRDTAIHDATYTAIHLSLVTGYLERKTDENAEEIERLEDNGYDDDHDHDEIYAAEDHDHDDLYATEDHQHEEYITNEEHEELQNKVEMMETALCLMARTRYPRHIFLTAEQVYAFLLTQHNN